MWKQIENWFKSRTSMTITDSLFIDVVNGRTVYEYTDCFNVKFMAQSKFGMRVKRK